MTYVPIDLYEIRVYDNTGAFQFIPENVSRIQFTQRLNQPWNHQITIELSKEHAQVELLRDLADPTASKDWFVKIFRTDRYTGIREAVYSGFNITVVDQARTSGDLIFNLYGSGFGVLLNRRVVVPPVGESHSTKSGSAETILKSYVSDCMVSPIDANRIFPGFVIEADAGTGTVIDYSTRYINLLTVCKNIADAGLLDFNVIEGASLGEFIFRAKPLWGLDRRVGNTAGNKVTVFSFLFGNMNIPILSTNTSDEKNYVYVGGAGEGENRIIEEVQDAAAIATSPWGRKEYFLEARQQETSDALLAVGNATLEEKKIEPTLSFEIIQNEGSRWLTDWSLGDLVNARYFEYTFDKKIVEISVIISAQNNLQETFNVELSDARLYI